MKRTTPSILYRIEAVLELRWFSDPCQWTSCYMVVLLISVGMVLFLAISREFITDQGRRHHRSWGDMHPEPAPGIGDLGRAPGCRGRQFFFS